MRQLSLFLVLIAFTHIALAQNTCGNGSKIFSVPQNKTPKPVTKLGTDPEFPPLRHLNSSEEVYGKIKGMGSDRRYSKDINQLFTAMGYDGVNDPAFTPDDIQKSQLPFGAIGMLGDGAHNYSYTILTVTNRQNLDCWKIAAKEGSCSLYFMSDCGNAFYYTNPPAVAEAAIQMPPDNKRDVNMKIKVYACYKPEPCDCCSADADDMATTVNYKEGEQKIFLGEEKISNVEVTDDNEVIIEKVYIDVDKKTFKKLRKHDTEVETSPTEAVQVKHYTKN